ncbi:CHRD domain-containing protein [Mycobacterium sp. CVI_P3]|uniref:CHRD domain-containing protein n=1 Tax=Mycobacterium pinniadriaticum TaxID=2994102 RepID=A0ABT3SEI2_9MYCO|nr:CHRD domain-containing protein [Mycobacterium pinniadriaticum]MCX2931498.1 CHRD domain-containing protein [Mycobacterium pinniadriaticum]MCX2937922.1 CHRD domain-containing protein [Mycobacterium pinniadriaticum]
MNTRINNRRIGTPPVIVAGAAAVALVIAGCSSNSTQSAPSTTTEATTTTAPAEAAGPVNVPLAEEPSGTATLTWNPDSKMVTAKLQLQGFTPGSSHAMHIHQGSCAAPGKVVVPFPDVTADQGGAVNATVTSSQPAPDGLAAGTLLNIHLGPSDQLGGPDSLAFTPVSCADITPAAPAAPTTITMTPPTAGPRPEGSATLTYDPAAKTLTVAVTGSALAAGAHAEHIHLGSCAAQGAVKFPLNDLVAAADGTAEATTVIQNVDQAPPATGWYVNIHLGSASQIEQDGQPTLYFQPILCGDVGQ